ncbi:CidA/LrgA family protein [Candidatus Raskinella chloraquaticus]
MRGEMVLHGFVFLVIAQLAGESLAQLLSIPVPGPVMAVAALVALFWAQGLVPAAVGEAADVLLRHLSLLFVPAGVGVLQHLPLVRAEWFVIVVTVVASTLLTMTVTALVFSLVVKHVEEGQS